MQESTQTASQAENITVTIYGMHFRYAKIKEFSREHKIGLEEIIHLIATKLDWLGQFLQIEYKDQPFQ